MGLDMSQRGGWCWVVWREVMLQQCWVRQGGRGRYNRMIHPAPGCHTTTPAMVLLPSMDAPQPHTEHTPAMLCAPELGPPCGRKVLPPTQVLAHGCPSLARAHDHAGLLFVRLHAGEDDTRHAAQARQAHHRARYNHALAGGGHLIPAGHKCVGMEGWRPPHGAGLP